MLQREWLEKTESIKAHIHGGKLEEQEVIMLAQEFDAIKKNRPEVILI